MTSENTSCFDVWSSMEMAPRDGSEILCFTVCGDYEIARWLPTAKCWVSKRGVLVEPSHWMRLPSSPAPQGRVSPGEDESHTSH